MIYINKIVQFFTQYDFIVLPCISLALTLFCVANFFKNVYRKQNKKIIAVTRKVCSYPRKAPQYANALPTEYQRQWRAYVNSGAKQPSSTFEFAPVKNRVRLLRLVIIAAIVSCIYMAAFVLDPSKVHYLVFQIVFWLAFTLVIVVDKLIFKRRERKAKRIFARLVNELNRIAETKTYKNVGVDDTVKQLRDLQKCEPTNAVFEKASNLLRNKGLNADRTVEEQRKLNGALNGLLQSYTKPTNI